jgi:hypothetical protein
MTRAAERHFAGAREALHRNDAQAFVRHVRGLLDEIERPGEAVAQPGETVVEGRT